MMKKVIYIFMTLLLVSCGTNRTADIPANTTKDLNSSATGISTPKLTVQSILSNMETASYKQGELLVKFKSGVLASASLTAHQAAGASVAKRFTLVPNLEQVKLPEGLSVSDAIVQYMDDPNVEYAEPNYIRDTFSTTPNDTYFGNQWALENRGLYASGTSGADIKASDAWDISTGNSNIVIAVLDTGIDYNHSDLVGNIWTNAGETSCTDGIDNDGNGYIDDCKGWDFVGNDNDPMDDYGHGTHVAGTIGAAGNNGEGVSGVMWNVRLMPVKFLDADGYGTVADEVEAIEYAVANGAKIINASFGSSGFSMSECQAINTANSAGVLFIAAAGNGGGDGVGDNNDLMPMYPASYDLPNIISVAATDQNDIRVPFSNYGPISVDVAAPGVYVFSTVPNWWSQTSDYEIIEFFAGTSMAAPHVSGLAGLLYSYYDGVQNTQFSYSQIRSAILLYVDELPTLDGWIETGGRINAYLALSSLLTPANLTATAASSSSISLSWTDMATGESGYKIERKTGGNFAEIANTGPDSTTFSDSGLNPSTTYSYRVRAYNNIPVNSFYSNEASAMTPSETNKSSGGGCSLVAGQNTPTVDIAIMLIPLVAVFMAIIRRKRKYRD